MNRDLSSKCRLVSFLSLVWVTGNVAADALASPPPRGATLGLSAAQAAEIARETTGGQVLAVRTLVVEEPRTYAVRLLVNPGHVRTVVVDSDSGTLR
ncbi:MAG: hypothetical protein EXR83_11340 [Gammaproteobacteria bacterium]|nr:hypothetical protein [Gammaproteobacteria bacterium]